MLFRSEMRHESGDLRLSICLNNVNPREYCVGGWGIRGLMHLGPQTSKKRCHRIVIALASAGKRVSKRCQATATVVAGSPLRTPPQARSRLDYSIVITDSLCIRGIRVIRRVKVCLLLTGDLYQWFTLSLYQDSIDQSTRQQIRPKIGRGAMQLTALIVPTRHGRCGWSTSCIRSAVQ